MKPQFKGNRGLKFTVVVSLALHLCSSNIPAGEVERAVGSLVTATTEDPERESDLPEQQQQQ